MFITASTLVNDGKTDFITNRNVSGKSPCPLSSKIMVETYKSMVDNQNKIQILKQTNRLHLIDKAIIKINNYIMYKIFSLHSSLNSSAFFFEFFLELMYTLRPTFSTLRSRLYPHCFPPNFDRI